jgi:hypothetical protein
VCIVIFFRPLSMCEVEVSKRVDKHHSVCIHFTKFLITCPAIYCMSCLYDLSKHMLTHMHYRCRIKPSYSTCSLIFFMHSYYNLFNHLPSL